MRIKLYTIERRGGRTVLVSYVNDVTQENDVPRALVSLVSKGRRYCLFTLDTDPEYGRELASPYVRKRQREHALRLWARGAVVDVPEKRPALYPQ